MYDVMYELIPPSKQRAGCQVVSSMRQQTTAVPHKAADRPDRKQTRGQSERSISSAGWPYQKLLRSTTASASSPALSLPAFLQIPLLSPLSLLLGTHFSLSRPLPFSFTPLPPSPRRNLNRRAQICRQLSRRIADGSWSGVTWGIAGRSRTKLEDKVIHLLFRLYIHELHRILREHPSLRCSWVFALQMRKIT